MIFQRNDNSRIPRRRVTANNNATQSHRNAAIHARAKALLKKIEESDRRERIEKARALAKKTALKQERSGGITWRGQKIPSSWFYPEHRKNWWDKKS